MGLPSGGDQSALMHVVMPIESSCTVKLQSRKRRRLRLQCHEVAPTCALASLRF
jgi:hypothetical protein